MISLEFGESHSPQSSCAIRVVGQQANTGVVGDLSRCRRGSAADTGREGGGLQESVVCSQGGEGVIVQP
jgi:hypothetical protein